MRCCCVASWVALWGWEGRAEGGCAGGSCAWGWAQWPRAKAPVPCPRALSLRWRLRSRPSFAGPSCHRCASLAKRWFHAVPSRMRARSMPRGLLATACSPACGVWGSRVLASQHRTPVQLERGGGRAGLDLYFLAVPAARYRPPRPMSHRVQARVHLLGAREWGQWEPSG